MERHRPRNLLNSSDRFLNSCETAAEPRPKQWMRHYLCDLQRNPSLIYSTGVEAEDLYVWAATITSPPETPYEGGIFNLRIMFPL
ncbi:hypothetical protein EUTSA_v10015758mg, partial [Eutrema salsugineum]